MSKIRFLILLYVLVAFLYLLRLVFDVDEGIALYNAWQFWNGNTAIYTKHFVEYISPGTSLSVYSIWKIFGAPGYFYAHLLFFVFWLVGLCGLILIIRKYALKVPAALCILFYWLIVFRFTSHINHNAFAASVSVILLYQLLALNNRRSYVLSGALNALVLWYLQTTGVIFAAVALIYFLVTGRKISEILSYGITFVSVSAGLLAITGLGRTFVSLFIIPFGLNYLPANSPHLNPWLIVSASAIVILMAFWYSKRRRPEYLLLLLTQVLLYAGSIYNLTRGHYVLISLPAVIFAGMAVSDKRLIKRFPPISSLTKILALILGLIILTVSFNNIYKPKAYDFDRYNRFGNSVNKANNIYAGPYLPAVYYYTGKTTSYPLSHIDIADKKSMGVVLGKIKEIKPEIAFLNYSIIPVLDFDRNNDIDRYIRKNYISCGAKIQGTEILALLKKYCPEE